MVKRTVKPEVHSNKIVVLSGSGISAESGLPTFRDSNGLWNSYSWMDLASPEGWKRHSSAWSTRLRPWYLRIAKTIPN